MLNLETLRKAVASIASVMADKKQYLIELDQRNGDGDLGISMADGYAAANAALNASDEKDLGRQLIAASKAFNEAAPSSLGPITSLGLMGMAKVLKGHVEADTALLGEALDAGVAKIMEKANSKPGEKTILDALYPAAKAVQAHASEGSLAALEAAAKAAKEGSDSTASMLAVHGRAAYYGDKALGLIDGGSVVGYLVFDAIVNSMK